MMFKVILLQILATGVAAVIVGIFAGWRGFVSAVLGGVACTLPNFLFAWRLKVVANRPGTSFMVNLLLGELLKGMATIVLLVLAAKLYSGLHWPSLLIGLVFATQAVFLAFWKKN